MVDVTLCSYPAPSQLVEHCMRSRVPSAAVANVGSRDRGDVAALVAWLNERDEFSSHDAWVNLGMAVKLEYGSDGLELWRIARDKTVTDDVEQSKWESFATDPQPGCVTIASLLSRAHQLGWRGSVRKSTASMFDGVAAIAAAAGATLHSGLPTPPPPDSGPGGVPMMAGQAELARLAAPILAEFLAATTDAPLAPISDDFPTLPAAMDTHALYSPINDAICRVMSMAEPGQKWKPGRVTAPLAALLVVHADVFESLCRRIENLGRTLLRTKIKLAAKALEDQVQRAFVKQDDWVYDARSGLPESDNPDNVVAFLGIISCEIRWNAWLNRAEVQGFEWPVWQALDDVVIAKLTTRAFRTGTRFRVTDGFLKQNLLALAHLNQHDPVLDALATLKWDGQARLAIWLSRTCGVPCDIYHQAVGKNVIGGMVKRARRAGAKHDEVMILIGPQGTLKSTLCRVLALSDDWFTDSVAFDGTPQNIVPQLFGKLVVELAELDGMAKKEVQHIKAFITRQSDNVTLKYKAFANDFARRCIFIGTSNEDSPLVDVTGNRRFLPVRVSAEADIAWLRANIHQLVAEAAELEAAGEDFAIPRDVWAAAGAHQEAARSVSDIEARLCDWFAVTPHTAVSFVTTSDLAELSELAGWRNLHTLRNMILRKLGFREVTPYIGGAKVRGWFRGPADTEPKQIGTVTRYRAGKTQDGRPRVIVSASVTPQSAALPPVPGLRT